MSSSPSSLQRTPPPRNVSPLDPMTCDTMQRAMTLLDAEIAKSELLMSVTPIRLISVGGSLAVCLLRNRVASYDIDCVLDPNLAAVKEYADEFKEAVLNVAEDGGFGADWLNRQLETFISRDRRTDLFLESVDQGINVYTGSNLLIFAGRLDWALERKMRRVAHAQDRRGNKNVDIPDAAALVRYMVNQTNQPLSFEYIRGLNYNGFDVMPSDSAMMAVAKYYAETYGSVGLAEMVWDTERNQHRYQGLDGEWIWC
ncbi:hypothetical protein PT974_10432 [Cladobotryum mycophilum]|uniref:Nucleotidyl transferase AbiEii/AbiGii toxin family protein n=1 Tax=Cladobotryum mycophilum TaxID=491253 RepID=A0ABR0SAU9_9HYPO